MEPRYNNNLNRIEEKYLGFVVYQKDECGTTLGSQQISYHF